MKRCVSSWKVSNPDTIRQANDFVNQAEVPQKAGFAFQSSVHGTQGTFKDVTAAAGEMASGFW